MPAVHPSWTASIRMGGETARTVDGYLVDRYAEDRGERPGTRRSLFRGYQATFLGKRAMQFIEMTGKTLLSIVEDDEATGLTAEQLAQVGVREQSVVRINPQGDIELRRHDGWDVIGGLLGEFEERIQTVTGLDWA